MNEVPPVKEQDTTFMFVGVGSSFGCDIRVLYESILRSYPKIKESFFYFWIGMEFGIGFLGIS
ncbi:hypothetical protein AB990_10015 [Alkalihalobacillus pseudalcaliphilus]|nr:hypothetical protein AB990_10015 [Alkalihalobacillus pseudalcaliphilus]